MNIPIRDIKPNAEIIDIWWYVFLSGGILLVLSILIFTVFYLKNKKKNYKKTLLKQLKNLPFHDSKTTAYMFTALAKAFVTENNIKEYEEIVNSLEIYKYKKEVPPLDEKTKEKIIDFIKRIK